MALKGRNGDVAEEKQYRWSLWLTATFFLLFGLPGGAFAAYAVWLLTVVENPLELVLSVSAFIIGAIFFVPLLVALVQALRERF